MANLWVKTGRGGWVRADQIIAIETQHTDVTITCLAPAGTVSLASCPSPERAATIAKSLAAELIRSPETGGLVTVTGEYVSVETDFEDAADGNKEDTDGLAAESVRPGGAKYWNALADWSRGQVHGWTLDEEAFHDAVLEQAILFDRRGGYGQTPAEIKEVASKVSRCTWHWERLRHWAYDNVKTSTNYRIFLRDVTRRGHELRKAEQHKLTPEEVEKVAADIGDWTWRKRR